MRRTTGGSKIVYDAGHRSWVGIEYEGRTLPEFEEIAATKRLRERIRGEMMSAGGEP